MDAIAAQIRALIDANAPGLHETLKSVPDIALVAAGPVAIVLVLILLFTILGALGGGKKRKAAREAAAAETEDDDLPRPAAPRPTPVAPPPAPPPPQIDRRAATLLEALRKARPAEVEPPTPEQRAAQEEAVVRVLRESPGPAKLLLDGDLASGFAKLGAEAEGLQQNGKPRAAQAWRDLGVMLDGLDQRSAVRALGAAYNLDQTDFWGDMFLARLLIKEGRLENALAVATSALACAKGSREKAIGQVELGDAHLALKDYDHAREAYQSAIEMTRFLARSGEHGAQRDLSVCLNRLGDLEGATGDKAKARALLEEDLTIARHLASAQARSFDAQHDLIVSLAKLGNLTNERKYWVEARDMTEALARTGQLPASDNRLLEVLRDRAAS